MTRFLAALTALAAMGGPVSCAASPANVAAVSEQAAERPNVVIIYADDMAYGDMSANDAGAWVDTPNLDALAASGVRFTDGYSAAPVCGPSRVAMLTGSYPARYGTWWNPDTNHTKIRDDRLLTSVMGKAGYATAAIGKWNLPNDPEASTQVVRSKMIWGGSYWPGDDGEYTGVGSGWGAGKTESGQWDVSRPGKLYLSDKLTDEAIEFIGAQDGSKPFFLYLAYNAPHSPLQAAEKYRARVAHLDSEPARLYAAMVLSVDDGVGRVREQLSRRGFDANTIVLFASDNGPAASDFAGYPEDWPEMVLGSVGPLSGHKRDFREGGIREPFVVSWPGTIPAGRVERTPVMTTDFFATVTRLAGASVPDDGIAPDGMDLLPLLRSGRAAPARDLFWAGRICGSKGCTDSGALRNGRWKILIENGTAPQLFDLSTDPGESRDLSAARPAMAAAMADRYAAWKAVLPANAAATAKTRRPRTDQSDDDK